MNITLQSRKPLDLLMRLQIMEDHLPISIYDGKSMGAGLLTQSYVSFALFKLILNVHCILVADSVP